MLFAVLFEDDPSYAESRERQAGARLQIFEWNRFLRMPSV